MVGIGGNRPCRLPVRGSSERASSLAMLGNKPDQVKAGGTSSPEKHMTNFDVGEPGLRLQKKIYPPDAYQVRRQGSIAFRGTEN